MRVAVVTVAFWFYVKASADTWLHAPSHLSSRAVVHRAVRRPGWRRPRHVEKRRRGPCGGTHGQSLGREGNWVLTWLGAHCCSGDHGRGLGGLGDGAANRRGRAWDWWLL